MDYDNNTKKVRLASLILGIALYFSSLVLWWSSYIQIRQALIVFLVGTIYFLISILLIKPEEDEFEKTKREADEEAVRKMNNDEVDWRDYFPKEKNDRQNN
jgi:predicted membrane protein